MERTQHRCLSLIGSASHAFLQFWANKAESRTARVSLLSYTNCML